MKDINLTAIVPIFNEEKYLFDSVTRLQKTNIFNEIILIDNCSTDESFAIAQNLKEKDSSISVLQTNTNSGKASAVQLGLNFVKTSHVVTHDADLEYFPSDIVEMFEISKNNPECLVLGTRFTGEKERKNVYFRTRFANRVMSLFFSVVNFSKITDVATCYKLMPTQFFQSISLNEQGFSVEIEILSKFLKTNNKIMEIPIKYEGRSYSDGKKIKTLDGFMYLLNTLKYRFFN